MHSRAARTNSGSASRISCCASRPLVLLMSARQSGHRRTPTTYPRCPDVGLTSTWWLPIVAARYIEPILLTLVIEMAILGVLKEHEAHGYELKKQMAELAGGPAASHSAPSIPRSTGSSWPAPSA